MPHMAGTAAGRGDGHHGSDHVTTLALAERMRRARHRLDSPLVSRSHRYLQSTPPAPFQHRMSITTIERARNYCSTGIAPSRTRSGHAESEGSSPPRKSAACIIATNVSPLDSLPLPVHQRRTRRLRASILQISAGFYFFASWAVQLLDNSYERKALEFAGFNERQAILAARRSLKMARSVHAPARRQAAHFSLSKFVHETLLRKSPVLPRSLSVRDRIGSYLATEVSPELPRVRVCSLFACKLLGDPIITVDLSDQRRAFPLDANLNELP